jgi:hypothetical protein
LAINPADGLPLNRVRPDATQAGATVDYQPPQDLAEVPRLAVVAGSGPATTSELTTLLRRRLRFLSVLFAVLFGVVMLLMMLLTFLVGSSAAVSEGAAWWNNVRHATFAITVLVAVILSRRERWTYGQLRLMELLLFGTLTVFFLVQNYFLWWRQPALAHAVELTARQQGALAYRIVTGLNHNAYMPAYMSPEQASGQEDIYSIGALAYFLLAGQPPFAGRSGVKVLAAHLYELPVPLTNMSCPCP